VPAARLGAPATLTPSLSAQAMNCPSGENETLPDPAATGRSHSWFTLLGRLPSRAPTRIPELSTLLLSAHSIATCWPVCAAAARERIRSGWPSQLSYELVNGASGTSGWMKRPPPESEKITRFPKKVGR
jgi:hypothetical protein